MRFGHIADYENIGLWTKFLDGESIQFQLSVIEPRGVPEKKCFKHSTTKSWKCGVAENFHRCTIQKYL